MKFKLYPFVVSLLLFACSKPNNYSNPNAEVTKEWMLNISSVNENHSVPTVTQKATLHLKIFSDNSISYDVLVDSLYKAGDGVRTVQINAGDPVTDGPLLLDLNPRISGAYLSGIVKGVSQAIIDTLINDNVDKYVNVVSVKAPEGLLRGQLNKEIVFAKNVELSGGSVVPAVNTTSTGMAYIRVTSDQKLYSKIIIFNDEAADPVSGATVNQGSSGSNGSAIATLANTSADFGSSQVVALTESSYTTLLGNSSYICVRSPLNNNGKLRGQIK